MDFGRAMFGPVGGTVFALLVAISCFGALNGKYFLFQIFRTLLDVRNYEQARSILLRVLSTPPVARAIYHLSLVDYIRRARHH
jgi:hypothetical protein